MVRTFLELAVPKLLYIRISTIRGFFGWNVRPKALKYGRIIDFPPACRFGGLDPIHKQLTPEYRVLMKRAE